MVGTTEYDRQVGGKRSRRWLTTRLQVRRTDTVPYAEIMEQVRQLPAGAWCLREHAAGRGGQTLSAAVAEELSTLERSGGMVTHSSNGAYEAP